MTNNKRATMKNYLLLFFCLFTLVGTATEYSYNYQENSNLETAFYGITGEPNIQYQILYFLLPLDEELVSLQLLNEEYQTFPQEVKIFPGYASITDGQIVEPSQAPSALFPPSKSFPYQTYYKQGLQLLIVKIPHQSYHYQLQKIDLLLQAEVKIITKERKAGYKKSSFLTKREDFEALTKGVIVEDRVRDSYFSFYANPYSSGRNSLNLDPSEMLIISPNSLISAWQNYADYKSGLGVNTQVVDITSITSTYSGRDNAEKLRNFLIDIYTEWSNTENPLRFVLLGGDYNLVPARLLRISAEYNSAWHNNNVYSDLYYAALDGNWDNDSDNLFGEGDNSQDSHATGMNGDEADLFSEIALGRIPVESTMELENWINKQQDYASAQVSEQFYEKVLLLGEYLGSSIYGAPSMNELANYLSDYSLQTLYAQNSTFSEANLTSAINSGVSQVHHLGHGSPSAVFSVDSTDLTNNFINQNYPLIYTQGCNTANFSVNDSIAENFIINQRGAFAYIGNTSYGFYSSFENQGPSQLFHREFVDAYTTEELSEIGIAFQDGKEDLVGITGQTGTKRYVYFDNILFADPSTELIKSLEGVEIAQISNTSLKLTFSNIMGSQALNSSNYSVYQRDAVTMTYPVTSISQQGNDYFLNFASDLPAGIPLRITITNIPNLLNPTVKLVKSLYTIKESSVITPTVWRADESPIYVYKHQIVNSLLTIEPGTEIRVNSDKSFYIYWGGKIQVEGDSLNFVTFTSYSDNPVASDKWTDLTFMMESAPDSYFNYTMIKNSQSGIWLDSLSTITLDHVRFKDNQNYGIYAKYSTINADYLEITGMTNSEGGAFRMIGGTQYLNHLTTAENAGYELIVTDSALMNLTNSIIWGQSLFDSEFLTIDYSILTEPSVGIANLSTNPLFISTSDFSLQSTSPAINSGNTTELDPDNTITDRGYWSFYHPNSFTAEIISNSSPKTLQFNNLSLGEYDSILWDFNNDGVWDATNLSPQHLYLEEGAFSVKMRLTKDSFQEDILLTDLINQSFASLPINFPVTISLTSTQVELSWDSLSNSDLYRITASTELETAFSSLAIQAETTYQRELTDDSLIFYQIIALEQIIAIAD